MVQKSFGTVPHCVSDGCRKYGRLASYAQRYKKWGAPRIAHPIHGMES